MAFDIEGARGAGYSDAEIADFLGKDSGFDVAGAQKAGYSPAEIVGHLSSIKAAKPLTKTALAADVEPAPAYGDPGGTGASEIMAAANQPTSMRQGGGIGEELANLRDSFFTGIDNTIAAAKTLNMGSLANRLQATSNRLKELEARGEGNSVTARQMHDEIASVKEKLPRSVGEMTEAQANAQRGAALSTRPAVAKISAAKTFSEAWNAFKESPYDVIAGVTATSLPSMLPALVAGAVMGPGAGALAMGASSAAVEGGSSLADFARDAGVDVTNAKDVETFFTNPENLASAMAYAGKRAGIIGALDAASGGLAGKTIAPALKSKIARQAVNLPTQMAAQAGLGAGGEAGAQLATKGKIDQPGQVLMEAAGELGGAPAEIAAFSKEARKAIRPATPTPGRIDTAEQMARARGFLVPEPTPQQRIAEIGKAENVDQAIAAAQSAVQSSTAVDNIAAILERNQPATPTQQAQAAIENIAGLSPEIAQTTQAITELEAADVRPIPGVSAVSATPAGGGLSEPGIGVETGLGVGTIAGPAVDARSVRAEPTGDFVPLEPGARLDAVDQRLIPVSKRTANVQDQATARPATQGQTAPAETPEAGARAGVQPSAAGIPAGTGAVQAAGVDQRLAPDALATQGKQVSFYPGKYGKGMGKESAKLEAQRLNRVSTDKSITYTAEEHGDPRLENPWAVVGRSTASTQKQDSAQSIKAKAAIETIAEELPNSAQQRADFAASEKARKVPGNAARTRASEANPFRAFLGKHGISNSLTNEFAPGRKERQAAMVQGYGPIFRKSGPQLDALAERAVEEGFLLEPDEAKLQNLILDALRGKRIIAQYAEGVAEDEMQARISRQQELEQEAEEAFTQLPESVLEDLDAGIPGFDSDSNTSAEAAMQALGFTDQEIQDAIASQLQGQSQSREGDGEGDAVATRQTQGTAAQGTAAPQDVAEGLTAPSQQDVLAQQQRAAEGAAAETKAATAAENRARADAELPEFTLTGSTRPADADPNQRPMFSRAERATEILDAAGLTGKERLDVLKDVKAGTLTPDEVKAAYPAKIAEPLAMSRAAAAGLVPALEPFKTKSGATAFKTPEIALANPRLNVRQPGGDVTRIDFEIRDRKLYTQAISEGATPADAREEASVGTITLDVDSAGVFKSLRNIEVFQSKRGNAIAEKVVGGIVESLPAGAKLHIHDILPKAVGFWDKMGAKFPRSEDFMEANLSPQQFRNAYDTRKSIAGTRRQPQESRAATDAGARFRRSGPDGAPEQGSAGRAVSPAPTVERAQGVITEAVAPAPTTGLSQDQFKTEMVEAFGQKVADRLIDKGVVVPLADQASLPPHVVPFLRDNDVVYGFHDPKTNRTYAVLGNLQPGMAKPLVLHEVGVHYGFKKMLGTDKYNQVMRRLDVMRRGGNEAVKAAHKEAGKNAARVSQIPEESLAYLVQSSPDMGIVREIVAKIKAFLFREFGIGGKTLTTNDLNMLARAAVRYSSRTEPGGGGMPAFSRSANGAKPGQVKDLIIQHNLTAENLLHADRMGGLAVPSLAITKAGQPMQSFGEITLLGDRNMADPKQGIKAYGADIYSPRYPQISYQLERAALTKLNAALAPYRKEGDREIYGGEITQVDDLTSNKAFKAYADPKNHANWSEIKAKAVSMLQEVGATERLFLGFTDSGNRRYKPHTLENVIAILKKELRGGENFNYGAGSLRAKFTPQFRSIEAIKKAKGSLVTKEQFEAIKDEIDNELVSIAEDLNKPTDTAIAIFEDAPRMGLKRAAAQYNIDLGDEMASRMAEFLTRLRNMPTEYFEGKFLRSVGISEFKAAVVPSDIKPTVLNLLEREGVKVFTYKNGDEADRAKVIKAAADSEEDLMFSRTATQTGTPSAFDETLETDGWSMPDPTHTDSVIYELQDARVDLKRVQEAIKATGKEINEKFDARQAETLYAGRLDRRWKSFLKAEGAPLFQSMALNKIDISDLEDYLIARHAPERNAQIAKVNPDLPDGGAGRNSHGVLMTDDAAAEYLAAIPADKLAKLANLARRVDAITAGTRALLVGEGLEKQETVDAWTRAYKNYVPLFKDEAEHAHPQGRGFTVKGPASKRATGSTKEVTNVIAHVFEQRDAAITRAEKNRVGLSLYGLALSNPNSDFWTTIKPNMSNEQIMAELQAMGVDPLMAGVGMASAPTIRTVDPLTDKVVDRPNPMYKNLPGAITLRVNGEDRVLMLNQKNERALRMALTLKNSDGLTQLDISGSIIGKATRWIASVNTQYNPAFGLVNVTRDTLGGIVNLTNTPLRKQKIKVLANVPAALKGIARDLRGDTRTEWSDLFNQFQDDGGQTGFKEMFRTADDRAKAIEKEIAAAGKSGLAPGKMAHAVLDLLDDFNTSLENAVRLSAYKAALDEGMSRPASAKLARELTVDFNRKGRLGRELGPLYAFFNASVQGTARTLETLAGPAGAKIIAGGLALGSLQAMMLAAAGFEDDEPPEWVKSRALIIPIGGEKRYIAIPYPLGLHVIPNTGRVLTELTINGGKDIGKRSVEAIGEIAGAFNPMGGGNIFTTDGALRTLAPTVIDPLIELAANKNFADFEIEKKPFREEGDNRPGFQRARESTQRSATGQVYLGISKAVNAITGGNDFEAGFASPTPERVRYLAQTVGGGVLRELEKLINTSVAALNDEEVTARGIPVVGRFYGEIDPDQTERSRYFESAKRIEKFETSRKAAQKAGASDVVESIEQKHPEVQMANRLDRVQNRIKKLNKQAAETINDRKELKLIDEDRFAEMKDLNDEIKAMERAGRKPTIAERLRGETE